jgi:hypothetical protein
VDLLRAASGRSDQEDVPEPLLVGPVPLLEELPQVRGRAECSRLLGPGPRVLAGLPAAAFADAGVRREGLTEALVVQGGDETVGGLPHVGG